MNPVTLTLFSPGCKDSSGCFHYPAGIFRCFTPMEQCSPGFSALFLPWTTSKAVKYQLFAGKQQRLSRFWIGVTCRGRAARKLPLSHCIDYSRLNYLLIPCNQLGTLLHPGQIPPALHRFTPAASLGLPSSAHLPAFKID